MAKMTLNVYRRKTLFGRPKWDWRLIAVNTNNIATSGNQGYSNRSEAVRLAKVVTNFDNRDDIELVIEGGEEPE